MIVATTTARRDLTTTFEPCARNRQDAQLEQDVRQALRSSSYGSLRRVQVRVDMGHVAIEGSVPSYYLKQMAQAVAMSFSEVESLQNDLLVFCDASANPASCDLTECIGPC